MEMKSMDTDKEIALTPIQKFYSGLSVFITGASGFLGQLIVVKLLRSCPSINHIYVLIREKKGKSAATRIDEILNGVLFENLKDVYPNYKTKVTAIEGDCGLHNLGISDQDRNLLMEVSVVIHAAATVNFNEKLKTAIEINVKGTRDIIDLCKEITNLKALVYVSTAYSNCIEDVIEEKLYPPFIEPEKLFNLIELLNEYEMKNFTDHILSKYPNTYIFAKGVAEAVVEKEAKHLPVAIYRPSIVTSTYREPLQGWTNNLYGPVGLVAGVGAGLIRIARADPKVNANIVPADMCVNTLLAIPWELNNSYLKTQRDARPWNIPIYQYESSQDQPIDWKTYMDLTSEFGVNYPPINAIWYYSIHLIRNIYLYKFGVLFLHYLPGFLMDAVLFFICKKPRFIKIYQKVYTSSEVMSYFCLTNFKFKSTKVRELIRKMSPEDQEIFFCDIRRLDWKEYFKTQYRGVRVYVMNDPLSTLPQAKKRYSRLYWCHVALKAVLVYIFIRIIWTIATYIITLE